jgi:CNT family concentrative nucleoside transporter
MPIPQKHEYGRNALPMSRLVGVLGLLTLLGLAYAFSTNRRAIRLKTVAWGLGLQIAFAFLVLKWSWGEWAIRKAGQGVTRFLEFALEGSGFVFGQLGRPDGQLGRIFAFQVLPTIIFVAAFFAVLYHFGIMQFIIKQVARAMTALMSVSGVESLNVAASVFVGQTEAPLTVRPFLSAATRSELMTIMTAGMAHVSGGIMAAYINFGIRAENLLAAVVMTAPGTILVAKMLVPETEEPVTRGKVELVRSEEEKHSNVLGAIARGTIDGGQLAWNVAIMLIAFIALIFMVDGFLGWMHGALAKIGFSYFPASLADIFGPIFAPIAWLIGVPWKDATTIGNLLGTRMVINELVAFEMLGKLKDTLDPRSFTIASFALCGFANFSSIGIQIGGIGALIPHRRDELARLGLRAMLAGTMANLMSAAIVGIFL